MPILQKNLEFRLTETNTHDPADKVIYSLFYQRESYNVKPFFAAIPRDQADLRELPGIELLGRSSGQDNLGFKGNTEKEAVEKMKAAMIADYQHGVKKEKVLLIDQTPNDKGRRSYSNDHTHKKSVEFCYIIAVKKTRRDKITYVGLNDEGFETGYAIRVENSYSVVPWTAEGQAACERILASFKAIQEQIDRMVRETPDQLLTGQNVFLLPKATR